jgi:AbrB family looped-hinge helix DNA binding protein
MRITSKGQVTIPQEIRERCGLLPHTQLRFVVEDGRVLIEKEPAEGSPGNEGLQRLRRARLRTRLRGFQCVLDVITADPLWQAWSEEQRSRWLDRGPLLINPIVYAEIAFACEAIETVDDLLPDHLDVYRLIPREAAFLAARAHAEYRARPAA